ncbi:hypothetical protein CERZMDRAFT_101838 [Cercospora zeae-maydis SCOH1-5]|uniref:Uncharacterized protein n=1 Tax=Cercospora zeae-maydis SCOH1-5 TaxID=717836 RepID=A0A6A6F6N0_9PEZI|nr:hypothetical protein CERZMDRAFT_101838 [Cercospora zeae-maydis SCOH1-5]
MARDQREQLQDGIMDSDSDSRQQQSKSGTSSIQNLRTRCSNAGHRFLTAASTLLRSPTILSHYTEETKLWRETGYGQKLNRDALCKTNGEQDHGVMRPEVHGQNKNLQGETVEERRGNSACKWPRKPRSASRVRKTWNRTSKHCVDLLQRTDAHRVLRLSDA